MAVVLRALTVRASTAGVFPDAGHHSVTFFEVLHFRADSDDRASGLVGGNAGELCAHDAIADHAVGVAEGCYRNFEENIVGLKVFGSLDIVELVGLFELRGRKVSAEYCLSRSCRGEQNTSTSWRAFILSGTLLTLILADGEAMRQYERYKYDPEVVHNGRD